MKITVKQLKEMIHKSVEDAVTAYPEYQVHTGKAEKSAKQEELENEIKHLLKVLTAEINKARTGKPHESIDGLFELIHQKREEKRLLNRVEDA